MREQPLTLDALRNGGRPVGDISAMLESFTHHLRARNRTARTIQSYQESVKGILPPRDHVGTRGSL